MSEDALKPTASARRQKALRAFAFFAVAALITWMVFGRIVPYYFIQHMPQAPAVSSEQNDRIEGLESRIKMLEEAKPAEPAAPVGEERIAHLEESIASMKTAMGTLQAGNKQQAAALSALGPLEESVIRGESFAQPLSVLTKLTANNATAQKLITQLAPLAETGVPTLSALQAQFERLVAPALASSDTGSIIERRLRALIRIRKVGEQQAGSDDEAVLARAQAKLARGEIEAALHETAALSVPAANTFAPWTTGAQSLLNVRTALGALRPAIMEDTPAPPPAPPNPNAPVVSE